MVVTHECWGLYARSRSSAAGPIDCGSFTQKETRVWQPQQATGRKESQNCFEEIVGVSLNLFDPRFQNSNREY